MKMLTIEMPDGSQWGVPVEVIARSRATHYAHEFGGDIERSMAEDTIPLFESDVYEVKDWATSNMNWEDVAAHARKLQDAPQPDFQEAWVNGVKAVIDRKVGEITPSCTIPEGWQLVPKEPTAAMLEAANRHLRSEYAKIGLGDRSTVTATKTARNYYVAMLSAVPHNVQGKGPAR